MPSNKNGWAATKSLLACRWLDSHNLLPLPVEVMWKIPRWKVCPAQAEDGNRFRWDAAISWPQALQVPRWHGKEVWIPGPHTPAALWHGGKTGNWKRPGPEASPDCCFRKIAALAVSGPYGSECFMGHMVRVGRGQSANKSAESIAQKYRLSMRLLLSGLMVLQEEDGWKTWDKELPLHRLKAGYSLYDGLVASGLLLQLKAA